MRLPGVGGDDDAFAEAAAELHTRLVRAAYVFCGDLQVAEDCAQDALLRAWERAERGETFDSLTAWTTTVALNACRSRFRRRSTEARALARLPIAREGADAVDPMLADEVRRAVLALPARQRQVVVLHHLLDQPVATIADALGRSEGAVKNALFRARQALAVSLADWVEEPVAASGEAP